MCKLFITAVTAILLLSPGYCEEVTLEQVVAITDFLYPLCAKLDPTTAKDGLAWFKKEIDRFNSLDVEKFRVSRKYLQSHDEFLSQIRTQKDPSAEIISTCSYFGMIKLPTK